MFIEIPDDSQDQKSLNRLFKKIRKIFGTLPPHYEMLGHINREMLDEIIKYVVRLTRHPTIDPHAFGFLRLLIAHREGFSYCVDFNTRMLLAQGYDNALIRRAMVDVDLFPFDDRTRLLARKSIKAIFDGAHFTDTDFQELYGAGWSSREIMDMVEHAGFMLRNGRILAAYLKKGT